MRNTFKKRLRTGVELCILQAVSKPVLSRDYLLVCAIDFGTTYSGWAYSFKHEYKSNPLKASVQHWHSGSSPATEKTPTVALISPDGKSLVAFGYEAENKYKELVENDEHSEYFYFRRFKMALNKDTINRNFVIKDELGKPLPAIKVFSLAIGYLADNVIKSGSDKVTSGITRDDVHWVLTVPAIWSDAAKQFMRTAAIEANLDPERLTIALEPEAASLFCRHLPSDRKHHAHSVSSFSAGTQYLVLDAGGGTVDITVHEVDLDGNLKEVYKASGGGWGGIMVDQAFEEFLIEILGEDVYNTFTANETEDYIDLWRLFEVKKKTIEPNMTANVVMKFTTSLRELYEKQTGFSMEKGIKETKYASECGLTRDKFKMNSNFIRKLFDKSITSTISLVKKIVSDCPKMRSILMVGGFSESPMLKEAIKKAFPELDVICPQDASSAILRGAVIFGHNPTAITHRVLKKTYGIHVDTWFIDGVHTKSRLKIIEGQRKCMNVFEKFADIGQTVKVGEDQHVGTYFPTYSDMDSEELAIYASDLQDPKYIDEGCTHIGKVKIDLTSLPKHLKRTEKEIEIRLSFSDTEIKATVRIVPTGKIITGTFDFLG